MKFSFTGDNLSKASILIKLTKDLVIIASSLRTKYFIKENLYRNVTH